MGSRHEDVFARSKVRHCLGGQRALRHRVSCPFRCARETSRGEEMCNFQPAEQKQRNKEKRINPTKIRTKSTEEDDK